MNSVGWPSFVRQASLCVGSFFHSPNNVGDQMVGEIILAAPTRPRWNIFFQLEVLWGDIPTRPIVPLRKEASTHVSLRAPMDSQLALHGEQWLSLQKEPNSDRWKTANECAAFKHHVTQRQLTAAKFQVPDAGRMNSTFVADMSLEESEIVVTTEFANRIRRSGLDGAEFTEFRLPDTSSICVLHPQGKPCWHAKRVVNAKNECANCGTGPIVRWM